MPANATPAHSMLAKWILRLKMLFQRKRADAQLQQELDFHLDQQIAENRAAGMSPEAARKAALRTFGNPGLLREQARATWHWSWFELLFHDLRLSLRGLRRAPAFTAIAVLVMALGIGANVAIFAVVHSLLLNPLPYRDPGRLVAVYSHNRAGYTGDALSPVDAGSFFAWRRAADKMADMAIISPYQNYNVSAEGGQSPEKVDAAWVSGNFFSLLGVPPILGRGLTEADDRREAEATVVLSHSFWKRRYSGDPNVIGRKIWLNAQPYIIVGVMPQSFVFLGRFSSGKIQVWTPVTHEASPWLMQTFEDHEFVAVARLHPGITLPQLIDRLDSVQKRIKAEHPGVGVREFTVGRPLLDDAVREYKTPLYALFAATGCVLLIACLNVASLLVARTAVRRKELAVRTALGGGRLRLMRERILESLLLTSGGGILGIFLAAAAIRWLAHARPDMSRVDTIHLDWTVWVFTAASVGFCALFSGLISALSINSRKVLSALQESSRSQSGGRARARLRRALLILEVGLTVVLLVDAGLLLKSYSRLRQTDLGIPIANTLSLNISLPSARYKTATEHAAFFERLIASIRAVPGVSSAGLVSDAPGQGWGGDRFISIAEHPPMPKGAGIDMMVRGADPGYFTAVGLPIMQGRTFADDERLDKDHVALISKAAVKVCFPDGEDPIGRHIKVDLDGDLYRIIGIVGDTRFELDEPPMPMMYEPIYSASFGGTNILVHSTQDVDLLTVPIEQAIARLDRDLPVSDVMTLEESVARSTVDSQFNSLLVLVFAVIALLLASVGLFGVLSYIVTQRTNELGLRIALGAQRREVLGLVLLDGLKPALIGLLAGVTASLGFARLIQSMLYGTQPWDPGILAMVSGTLLLVAALACLLPAWRASRLDPMQALRTE
jgi:putative ABC transport system permease protein